MDVGVRDLKQRLSHFLDRAERGELIRVTDRGRPKALLGPLPGSPQLTQGIDEGWVTPGSGGRLAPARRVRSARRVLDALRDDRGG